MDVHSLNKEKIRAKIKQAQTSVGQPGAIFVIESHIVQFRKKLAMPPISFFEPHFGKVKVDDFLRNEFCNEEDDFFIADEGFSEEMLFMKIEFLDYLKGAKNICGYSRIPERQVA